MSCFFVYVFNTSQIQRIFLEGRRKAEKDIVSGVIVKRVYQVQSLN